MSLSVEAGTAIEVDKFFKWLRQHANCILRAGSSGAFLYDHEQVHWHFEEDPDRNLVVQLVWGKNLVGEMIIVPREVLFVQATPDPDPDEGKQFLFELVGGGKDSPYALHHFLIAHAYEEEGQHGPLKH